MPFTPYHFGPSARIALPLNKYIDFPVFILANVVVDLEPLAVIVFSLNYPLHGPFHTFLFGGLLGLLWALLAYPARPFWAWWMRLFHLPYKTSLPKMLLSGILGAWLHVFIDSLCWSDVRPFWPLNINPFATIAMTREVYLLCTLAFIPAVILYIVAVKSHIKKQKNESRS